ncbi:MAG: DNA-processing protein DprA [Clostridia bacterium]|nr:DNA-processing protein DprA [Clostridia bacterium]
MSTKIPFTKEFGYVRLGFILGAGSHNFPEIIETFGDIEKISALTYNEWAESKLLKPAQLARVKNVPAEVIYETIKYCKLNDIRIITPEDSEYHPNFKYIEDPPVLLYARGQKIDTSAPHFAIVGARDTTDFGKKAAYSLGAKLALSGFTVVSGGALGVDCMAHMGALNAGGKTIVVLGCGIDANYLMAQVSVRQRAEKSGTVISEFPPKTPASVYTFPVRNRIISALSSGVAVIEAGKKSGALITANCAIEQGKELFAVPGNINARQYEGTNDLLRDGAIPLVRVEDIVLAYQGRFPDKLITGVELTPEMKRGYRSAAKLASKNAEYAKIYKEKRVSLAQKPETKAPVTNTDVMLVSENAKKIYLSFTKDIEISDILLERSGLENGAFITAVTELELFGYVKAVPVGRYERIK